MLAHLHANSAPIPPAMPKTIGQPLPRKEDLRLLTGAGRYSDDVNLPGQAYAAFVRSPQAHARIKAIDISAAGRSSSQSAMAISMRRSLV